VTPPHTSQQQVVVHVHNIDVSRYGAITQTIKIHFGGENKTVNDARKEKTRDRRFRWTSVGLLTAIGIVFVLDRSTLAIASAGTSALVTAASALVTAVVVSLHEVAAIGAIRNFGGYLGGSFAPVVADRLLERTQSFKSASIRYAPVAFIAAPIHLFLVSPPSMHRYKHRSISKIPDLSGDVHAQP
jgi:hypothetical protein